MNIDRTINLANFCHQIAAIQSAGEVQIQALPKPKKVGSTKVPDSLNDLTTGQLFELQQTDVNKMLYIPSKVILGLNTSFVMRCSAVDVLGFNVWVGKEMERIAKMFKQIPSSLTSEEKRAGADTLDFGYFGIIDNYAQRMGVVDHDYILDCVPWIRLWQVMLNDAKKAQYERRLRAIYAEKK